MRYEISPDKEDIVSINGLFDFNHLIGYIENSVIKLIIDAILELSKEKVVILPHPACELDTEMTDMLIDMFGESGDTVVNLPKDFLKKAKVITYEP